MLQVFDRVLTSQSHETLLVLLIGMAVALGLMLVLDYLRSRLQGVAGNLVAESLSPTVVKVMLDKLARSGERASSEGLRDVASLRNLFSAQGLLALFDAPWALVYILVIWLAHPVLGMAALGASILMLGLALINDRITRRDIEALQREAAKASRYLEASLQNAEVAQSLGMGDALIARWRRTEREGERTAEPHLPQVGGDGGIDARDPPVGTSFDAGARRLPRHRGRRNGGRHGGFHHFARPGACAGRADRRELAGARRGAPGLPPPARLARSCRASASTACRCQLLPGGCRRRAWCFVRPRANG